jgi:outer membrane putative beta-barrel porin/alpha-amylase
MVLPSGISMTVGRASFLQGSPLLVAAAILLVSAPGADAADQSLAPDAASSPDRSQYTLFMPTPDRLLRDMTTDRPDATESPFTVDAGRVQVETTLFGYSRSRPDNAGVVTDSFEFGTTNIRIGLTHNTEFNFIWQPYGIVRTRDPAGPVPRQSGVGGIDLRAKINLWGNDTSETPGATALGLLPFVSLPTDRNNGISPEHVEVGLIVPFAIVLSDKFGLGVNAGVSAVHDETGPRYHPEWIASASLSYSWSEALGTYYEIGGRFGLDDPRGDIVFVGTGVTYKLSKNLQLDAGINFGLTDAADRINPFVGISARF